jgi:hypothetical protein
MWQVLTTAMLLLATTVHSISCINSFPIKSNSILTSSVHWSWSSRFHALHECTNSKENFREQLQIGFKGWSTRLENWCLCHKELVRLPAQGKCNALTATRRPFSRTNSLNNPLTARATVEIRTSPSNGLMVSWRRGLWRRQWEIRFWFPTVETFRSLDHPPQWSTP